MNMKITLFEKQEKRIAQRFPFIMIVLKGVGQIMLQENAYTGFLFLAGIFYGSVTMGFGALIATICGTITAQILGYDKSEIEKGIYGFSAALVGVALTFYFDAVWITGLAVIIGSAMAAIIQHWFNVKKIPVFTLPFIIVTWFFLYVFKHLYPVAPPTSLDTVTAVSQDLAFAFRGYGQVIFQGSLFAGIVFFIGVFISSPKQALYGLVAALIAGVLSALYNASPEAIMMGLFSYNAVLCAIVFAGDREAGVWMFIAIALSIIVQFIMNLYELTPLTFPFVAGTCITLALQNLAKKYGRSKTRNSK